MSFRSFLPLFLFLLVATMGCGGGSDSGGEISAAPQPVYGNATLRISQQVRAQIVPERVDTVRITGFQSGIVGGVYDARAGGVPFPPRELPLAPVYTLENVPTNVDNIMLEYLDGAQVIGMYFQEVKLVDGQVYEIIDPAIASRPPELTEFSVFAGWTPPGVNWKHPVGENPYVWTGLAPFGNYNAADHIDEIDYASESGKDFYKWDALRRFTVWEISDPTIATVYNGSAYNSSFRAGNLKGLRPGIVTLTGRFFDLTSSVKVEFVQEGSGDPEPRIRVENSSDITGIDRVNIYRAFFEGATPTYDERDVTADLIYRPSDNPGVAAWDTTPGREGYFVRGPEVGRVALWARHPKDLNWTPVVIENEAPEMNG